jgi:polar amino acid transport system substrate-binding protein
MQARHVLTALAMACMASQGHACALTMALEQWPPYIHTRPEAKAGAGKSHRAAAASGLDLELAQAIIKEAGCTLRLLPELPTARRQRNFELGGIDLLLAASITPERRRYARFSIPYRHESVGVFARTSALAQYRDVTSIDALVKLGLPLLAPKIGWYGAAYARVQPAMTAAGQLSTFINFQQGLRMLDAGRADLIMGDGAALRYEAREQGIAISPLPFSVLRAPVHLMLNKISTSQAELNRLNAAIARLERNGALAEIRSRYGN